MMTQAHHDHPELSIQRLCELFGVSRSWYYEAQQEQVDEEETALRDEIEQLILELPGYGYRRVTKALQGPSRRSTTNECCGSCAKNPYCVI